MDRTFDYDTLYRLLTARLTDNQGWGATSEKTTLYQYDALGNRISHQYRDASAIGYAHDKANEMTTLAGLNQGYDWAGNLTFGYSADRGTSYYYGYDHNNMLRQAARDKGILGLEIEAKYAHDALGRRIEFVDLHNDVTTTYYYDGVNEIVEETDGSGDAALHERYFVHGVSYIDERLMMADLYKGTFPVTLQPYAMAGSAIRRKGL